MSKIRIKSIRVSNYRSFGDEQIFQFPDESHKKPVAIIGYNNSGKTNLMNAILYGIGEKFVSRDTFNIDDFHYKIITNVPEILLEVESSTERKFDGKEAILNGFHKLIIQTNGNIIEGSKIQSLKSLTKIRRNGEEKDDENFQAFGASRYFNIFYVNFHNIKDEISTQKSSWGNLKSFLAKHIKKLVDTDPIMQDRKDTFQQTVNNATDTVLDDGEAKSILSSFVDLITQNYSKNLRNNACKIKFELPDYEDIFLQMMFKIGLNGNENNLVPINHFGDGFISMFVMAVIQAIAETNPEDRCLFLFEEPESFLHENHQEYFYNMVLCSLAEKGHQVIYTTHSDRMVDIFDTQSFIRLEQELKEGTEENWQTVKKFNEVRPFEVEGFTLEGQEIKTYNNYIRYIEPNLNRILFSRKVILVEGPNDMLVYKFLIEKKVREKIETKRFFGNDEENNKYKDKYAQTYLSFSNIAIIPHHGKTTAQFLIQLCKYIKLDCFVITDWDFKTDFRDNISLSAEELEKELQGRGIWNSMVEGRKNQKNKDEQEAIKIATATVRGMITNNRILSNTAILNQIHFNFPRLEEVIGYDSNDKSSIKIWARLQEIGEIPNALFPESLETFLEFNKIEIEETEIPTTSNTSEDTAETETLTT